MTDSRRLLHAGRIIDFGIDSVRLPNGLAVELEIARHPGGAAALAIDAGSRVCLLRQFRHAAGGWIWEIPAGLIESAEAPLAAAARELREEAGVAAKTWAALGTLLPSPGFLTETVHLFLATGLDEVATARDPEEVMEVHWLDLGEALALADRDEITDAKTLAALYRAARRLAAAGVD